MVDVQFYRPMDQSSLLRLTIARQQINLYSWRTPLAGKPPQPLFAVAPANKTIPLLSPRRSAFEPGVATHADSTHARKTLSLFFMHPLQNQTFIDPGVYIDSVMTVMIHVLSP
jgi:hypothetical protein